MMLLFSGLVSVCPAAPNPRVVLETNFGDIIIELYPEKAPVTVDNFLSYVNSGFYDGLLFHRVIYGFMIQGGGFYYYDGLFYKAPTSTPIINESYNGLKNLKGTIAMARTPEPHSATSEFYINHINNPFLDRENASDGYGYCVFGNVVDGMDVVEAIAQETITQYYQPEPEYYFEAIPKYRLVGMYRAYILPCELSYCSDVAAAGRIDFADFAMFASHWLDGDCGSANGFCDGADLDYSGTVDFSDLDLFGYHWVQIAGYEPRFSDLIYNNTIDMTDLIVFTMHWLDSGCNPDNHYCDRADINRDGAVDLIDFTLLARNWLTSY